MAVIVLVSAAGSPGVTTTGVGFALTADRPTLLVEADPTGGSAVLAGLWQPLAGVLSGLEALGQDVVVDGGRLGLEGWPEPLLAGADLVLLTVRSDLVALAAARSWAETLRAGREQGGGVGVGLLLVGEGRPYSSREISAVLQLPVTATLAWDDGSAAVFSRGAVPARRFDRAPLPRSLRTARMALEAQLAAARAALEPLPVEVQR